ncbi:interleukin-1 receptor-associated kinase 1-binding protein 1 homolog [Denticeps clupeoides]|uniref:Interleukin-1 receptor-associated kinase 1-binding protein 1 n=1 Tax=Denticeps clupeoides TaxID=299321 RepID=A0AAY4CHX0_9TELE|nr:interleukin-1 receptor-associated kinase 1-binding protein 1 [Denticeps clupeoides]
MAASPSRVFATLLPLAADENAPSPGGGAGRPAARAREVQVAGSAQVTASADRGVVAVRVGSSKEAASDARCSVGRRLDYILQTLRQRGVKDEDTSVTRHIQRHEQLYSVEAEVRVVFSDFEKMEQVCFVLMEKLDRSVHIGTPQFTHSAESLSILRRRACVAAVENARLKANEVCCILGQALGRPLLVREEESREWGCGPSEEPASQPVTLQERVDHTAVTAYSRVFVTFDLKPKESSRRKM